jgi:multidrug efflux system membrane fusion protein
MNESSWQRPPEQTHGHPKFAHPPRGADDVGRRPGGALKLAGGLLVLCLLALAVRALTTPARAADPPSAPHAAAPVAVTMATVQAQNQPILRTGVGTVTAAASVTVKARIDGQLDAVGFTEGQDVKAGQVLARLDPRTLQAQLGQAQAQQARDEAQLANARVDLQRYTHLVSEDAATAQQLDTQKALVAQLEAAVQTDRAAVRYAQVQLSFTTITAPISGRTGLRLVDPGNIVHAADTNGLVVINQIDPIAVLFTLPEDVVAEVHRAEQGSHRALQVQALARDGHSVLATGELVLLNNQIDTNSGTVQLKARFANPAHTLWPGQYVDVRLRLGELNGALTVPAGAVQRGQAGTYAYVVGADGKAQVRPVTVQQIQNGLAVIATGLQAGEQVVADGQYKLRPGSAVVSSAGSSAVSSRAQAGEQVSDRQARP